MVPMTETAASLAIESIICLCFFIVLFEIIHVNSCMHQNARCAGLFTGLRGRTCGTDSMCRFQQCVGLYAWVQRRKGAYTWLLCRLSAYEPLCMLQNIY